MSQRRKRMSRARGGALTSVNRGALEQLAAHPGMTGGIKEWFIVKLLKPMGLSGLRSIQKELEKLIRALEKVKGVRGTGRMFASYQRGMGAETVEAPAATGITLTSAAPMASEFKDNGSTGTRFVGEEFIFNFDRQIGEYAQKIVPCNPLFWVGTRMAKLAKQFLAYRVNSMTVRYYPACASSTEGAILMSTRNISDNVPTGHMDAERYYQAKDGAVWGSTWTANACMSHEPMIQKYYRLDMGDMPETGDWCFTIIDSINTAIAQLGLGMLTVEYDISCLGKRNTTLGLQYISMGAESLTIVNSTMVYNHKVGTILYLKNDLTEIDLGGVRLTNLDRIVIIANAAGTATFKILDTRYGATDLLNTGGAIEFEGYEPEDEY
jgi:hypothetical protein